MSIQEHPKTAKNNTMTTMRRSRFFTRTSKPWNDRFHVLTTKDNPKLHLFYKELFGKPSHKKHEEVLLHDKGNKDPLFSTISTPMMSTLNSKRMRKSTSLAVYKEAMQKEQQWRNNFNVMGSKNNDRVHKHYQEYFDRPVEYDNQGYKLGVKQFGEIYDQISPLRIRKLRKKLRPESLTSMKHNKYTNYGNEDQPSETAFGQKDSTSKNIENSPNIKKAIEKQRNKQRLFRGSLERIHPEQDPENGVPGLRTLRVSPKERKKELGWKKVGDPISTYNELVHKAYRIGFTNL